MRAVFILSCLLITGLMEVAAGAAEPVASKTMSPSQISTTLAERTGLTRKQIDQVLDEQAKLAYEQAANAFTIRGIGKLVLVDQAARTGRNPQTGEPLQIPAKKAVKFRIAKACKDAILATP